MKKVFVVYDDKSKVTYTMKNDVDHMVYVNRHINTPGIESITLQQYPKKKNEPVVFK